jgi:ATP-dependent protease ClpP protease subunit
MSLAADDRKLSASMGQDFLRMEQEEGGEQALIASTPSTRRLRYYGSIDSKSLLSLNSILCNMVEESNEPIHLHIQSEGGELIPALYTSDLITSLPVEVHTYVDGLCASAATLLAVAGNVRHMSKNSIFLIHQLSTVHSGKYDDLTQALKNSEVLMENLINIYLKHTNLKRSELDQLLSRDKYLNAQTCLKYGLIDVID